MPRTFAIVFTVRRDTTLAAELEVAPFARVVRMPPVVEAPAALLALLVTTVPLEGKRLLHARLEPFKMVVPPPDAKAARPVLIRAALLPLDA